MVDLLLRDLNEAVAAALQVWGGASGAGNGRRAGCAKHKRCCPEGKGW